MLVSVHGVYRHGKIELIEQSRMMRDETRVVVTFLESGLIDLRTRGIAEKQAAELRPRLATFAEDWDSPEMSIYDNFDAAKFELHRSHLPMPIIPQTLNAANPRKSSRRGA